MTLPSRAGIAYEQNLKGRPIGRPLILIHGAGAEHRFWPPELRSLHPLRVLAPDLPGHGASPGPAAGSIVESATRLREWMSGLVSEPAILVGHSMGSAISLEFALRWPEQVAGLVLIGSGTRLPVNPWLLEATADPATLPKAVERITGWSFAREAPAALTTWVTERTLATAPGVLYQDLAACDAFDAESRLPGLRLPTLVVCGQQDRMTPPSASQALAGAIGDAELEFVADAGHYVMLEQPAVLERRIRDWINTHYPGAQAGRPAA
ncbi:MAG: alpha/beta hydrolase [Anaerolineales bacterium]|nr:alpha/beta hydrolase [Anaerolineales bacterium]